MNTIITELALVINKLTSNWIIAPINKEPVLVSISVYSLCNSIPMYQCPIFYGPGSIYFPLMYQGI